MKENGVLMRETKILIGVKEVALSNEADARKEGRSGINCSWMGTADAWQGSGVEESVTWMLLQCSVTAALLRDLQGPLLRVSAG